MAFGIFKARQGSSLVGDPNRFIYHEEYNMAWKELFTTDVGLGSLAVIVFVIGKSVFFGRLFHKKMVWL